MQVVVTYAVGDTVRITGRSSGRPLPASWMNWISTTIQVRVVVSMFGRETPVELELDQVELVDYLS